MTDFRRRLLALSQAGSYTLTRDITPLELSLMSPLRIVQEILAANPSEYRRPAILMNIYENLQRSNSEALQEIRDFWQLIGLSAVGAEQGDVSFAISAAEKAKNWELDVLISQKIIGQDDANEAMHGTAKMILARALTTAPVEHLPQILNKWTNLEKAGAVVRDFGTDQKNPDPVLRAGRLSESVSALLFRPPHLPTHAISSVLHEAAHTSTDLLGRVSEVGKNIAFRPESPFAMLSNVATQMEKTASGRGLGWNKGMDWLLGSDAKLEADSSHS